MREPVPRVYVCPRGMFDKVSAMGVAMNDEVVVTRIQAIECSLREPLFIAAIRGAVCSKCSGEPLRESEGCVAGKAVPIEPGHEWMS